MGELSGSELIRPELNDPSSLSTLPNDDFRLDLVGVLKVGDSIPATLWRRETVRTEMGESLWRLNVLEDDIESLLPLTRVGVLASSSNDPRP